MHIYIGEVCDMLGAMSLSSFGGNHWATGELWVNSTSVKGGLLSFPLFLLKGNAILSITPKAGSLVYRCIYQCASTTKYFLQLDEETLR